MTRVDLSRQAERHLAAIRRRLTRDAGPRVALSWISRIRAVAVSLSEFPERGALDAQLGRRRLVVRPYLIFYRIRSDDRIVVLDIIDGRRDLPSALVEDEAD
jgi:plasmid stabilization system protein ParE